MRRLAVSTFTLVFLTATATTQTLRPLLDRCTDVVVGEVQWVSDSEEGYNYRIDTPDVREPVSVCEVRVRVLSKVKGDAPAIISIALPKHTTWRDELEKPLYAKFDVRVHTKAIWFLQASPNGNFTVELKSPDSIFTYMWKAPGLQYSVAELQGIHPSWIPITHTDAGEYSSTILRLADIFARNASLGPTDADTYLSLLADMTPVPVLTIGYGKDLTGTELAEHMVWLNKRFPLLFSQDAPWKRLSAMAVRMQWGQEELSESFTNLYISAGSAALHCRFPQIPRSQDAIRLIPYVPTDLAGSIIRGLKRDRADRIEITRRAVRRFGEDHYLDGNILEALWKLWDMPELSPFAGTGSLLDDLSAKIALARRLVP
jgi:hypothetical protein